MKPQWSAESQRASMFPRWSDWRHWYAWPARRRALIAIALAGVSFAVTVWLADVTDASGAAAQHTALAVLAEKLDLAEREMARAARSDQGENTCGASGTLHAAALLPWFIDATHRAGATLVAFEPGTPEGDGSGGNESITKLPVSKTMARTAESRSVPRARPSVHIRASGPYATMIGFVARLSRTQNPLLLDFDVKLTGDAARPGAVEFEATMAVAPACESLQHAEVPRNTGKSPLIAGDAGMTAIAVTGPNSASSGKLMSSGKPMSIGRPASSGKPGSNSKLVQTDPFDIEAMSVADFDSDAAALLGTFHLGRLHAALLRTANRIVLARAGQPLGSEVVMAIADRSVVFGACSRGIDDSSETKCPGRFGHRLVGWPRTRILALGDRP